MRKPIDRRRVLDWLRHALVALLLISAFFLLRRTGYYAGIRSLLSSAPAGGESAGTDEPAAADASVGVKCVAVTVCGPEGGARYGVAYDPAAEGLLRRFSVDLRVLPFRRPHPAGAAGRLAGHGHGRRGGA